jgi:hypothetical protein
MTSSEDACRDYAVNDARAIAYDYQTACLGLTSYCRVRTLSPTCGDGFRFTGGTATTVTATNGAAMAICVIKTQPAR